MAFIQVIIQDDIHSCYCNVHINRLQYTWRNPLAPFFPLLIPLAPLSTPLGTLFHLLGSLRCDRNVHLWSQVADDWPILTRPFLIYPSSQWGGDQSLLILVSYSHTPSFLHCTLTPAIHFNGSNGTAHNKPPRGANSTNILYCTVYSICEVL